MWSLEKYRSMTQCAKVSEQQKSFDGRQEICSIMRERLVNSVNTARL